MDPVILDGDIESGSQLLAIAMPYELLHPACVSFRTFPWLVPFPQKIFHSTQLLSLASFMGRIPDIFSFCCMRLLFYSHCPPALDLDNIRISITVLLSFLPCFSSLPLPPLLIFRQFIQEVKQGQVTSKRRCQMYRQTSFYPYLLV